MGPFAVDLEFWGQRCTQHGCRAPCAAHAVLGKGCLAARRKVEPPWAQRIEPLHWAASPHSCLLRQPVRDDSKYPLEDLA